MVESIGAVKRHARIDVADVLRGVAVMGIVLLHNIEHFNFYSFPDTTGQSEWLTFFDKGIWNGLFFMFGGKAYAIFALLFGFSFFIQDDNSRMRGNDFRSRFCWRLFLLFIIGNINAMFFTAEVLVLYSLVGFILVLTCRMKTRNLIALAVVFMLQPVALYNIVRALIDPEFVMATLPTSSFWSATFAVQSTGGFMDTLLVNLWEGQLASLAWAWDNGRVFQTAALFIIGMLIGRNGWFLRDKLRYWGVAGCIAAACFFPLSGINDMLPRYISNSSILVPLQLIVKSNANLSFMVMIVSAVIFMYYCTSSKKILSKLIPYGKMSMTNYVTQSIIGSFLYYNWGLGLYRYLGITASVMVGALVFLLQLSACKWWLKRFKHGPFEGAWKKLTWIKLGAA